MGTNYLYHVDEYSHPNIVRFTLHLDEATPHVHAIVLPRTPDGWLSARDYLFGHKEKLRGLQERYAHAMEPFGLERGIEKKRVHYQTIQQYYRCQTYANLLD